MIKIENQKIELSILKNSKEVKKYDFKNTLTDTCLDLALRPIFPLTLKNSLFSPPLGSVYYGDIFGEVVFIFNNIKPDINVTTTTIDLDYESNRLVSYISYTDKGRIIKSTYDKSFFETTEKLQYICFTVYTNNSVDRLLTSFIDVSDLDIYGSPDLEFTASRYDYIESNEIQITANDNMPHLTRIDDPRLTWYLDTITTCYGANGVGDMKTYSVNDLDFERLSAGVVEVSGFDNYKIESNVLFCSEDTICGTETIITQPAEKIMSIRIRYSRTITGAYYYSDTYVNIEDLDVSYNDKELTIKMKCERGAY